MVVLAARCCGSVASTPSVGAAEAGSSALRASECAMKVGRRGELRAERYASRARRVGRSTVQNCAGPFSPAPWSTLGAVGRCAAACTAAGVPSGGSSLKTYSLLSLSPCVRDEEAGMLVGGSAKGGRSRCRACS